MTALDVAQPQSAAERPQQLEALGSLTMTTAHQLQNLLTVIVSNAALLATRLPPTAEPRSEFADLQSAARDASALLQTLVGRAREVVPVATPAAATDRRAGEGILLVDDDEPVRRAAGRILERLGYTVYPAANGEEALNLWRALRDQVALVVTDVMMPRLNGADLVRAIRADGDAVPVLFASGYSPDEAATLGQIGTGAAFLRKPWTKDELAAGVRAALRPAGAAE